MSNLDSFTAENAAQAEAMGWCLAHVIDAKTGRITAQILPLKFQHPFTHVPALQKYVIELAKLGNEVALRALHAMSAFNTKGKKK